MSSKENISIMKFKAAAWRMGVFGALLLLVSIGGCLGETQPNYQRVILAGGDNKDLFVRCDTSNWHCYGTTDRNAATIFLFTPWSGAGGKLQVENSDLCLNKWGEECTGDVNLFNCNPVTDNMVWYDRRMWLALPFGVPTNVERVASNCGTTFTGDIKQSLLWWAGDGEQLKAVYGCLAWQCRWTILNV